MRKPKKILYYEITSGIRSGKWTLTTATDGESLDNMRIYEGAVNFKLATLNNLLEYTRVNKPFEGLIELQDGLYQYQFYQDGNMKICGEYKKVGESKRTDLKIRAIQRKKIFNDILSEIDTEVSNKNFNDLEHEVYSCMNGGMC